MTKILAHVEQPDSNTCQSAAIARVLGTDDVYGVRGDLVAMGTAGDPGVMARYLRPRVEEYLYLSDGSLRDAKEAIAAGYELIIHGWFTEQGHVIGIRDYNPETGKFTVSDPWAEFDFPTAQYLYKPGNGSQYSDRGIFAYCVYGHSYADAQRIYAAADTEPTSQSFGGAWLHAIKN